MKTPTRKSIPGKDDNKHLDKLGKRIKDLRIKAGYASYDVFAYKHEISRTQWGRYENGQNLTFTSLVKVVEALDITLEDFFSSGF